MFDYLPLLALLIPAALVVSCGVSAGQPSPRK